MSEHLTQPERIAKLEVELGDAEDRVAKLEAALKDIAKQTMSDEMDQDQRDNADWQFGYDACVETARAALSETVEA